MARKRSRVDTVTATEAAKNFGELVDHVREAGTTYVVERQGRPIVQIAPFAARRCTLAMLVDWVEARAAAPGDEFRAEVDAHVRAVNRPRIPASRWRS
jgi:antitoxin (DNA-binding transcriptional repressor) of toxin-antitoxin stability system